MSGCVSYLRWKPGGSDAVRAADVAGVKEYRSWLHRALMERRPGQYTRRWLAGRLGVSEQTTRRYDLFQGVKVFPMYSYTRLFWHNLEQFVPKDTDKLPDLPGGYFLHCEGKDYPVRRGLVEKLLSQGKVVHFAKREPNYYTMEENWRACGADVAQNRGETAACGVGCGGDCGILGGSAVVCCPRRG